MRHVLVFALIAILLVLPVITVLVVVAGLTPDPTTARFESPHSFVAQSVALRALTLLRAPPA